MNLKSEIQSELTTLAAQGGCGRIGIDDGSGKLTIEVIAIDAIGCSIEQIAYFTKKMASLSMPQLTKLSQELTKKLTYLLEPIGVIETDLDSATIQLRSTPPQKERERTEYYELLVRRGGEITLVRWQKEEGRIRELTPAHFTREVLCRLACDLQASGSQVS